MEEGETKEMTKLQKLVDRLEKEHDLTDEEFVSILESDVADGSAYLTERAAAVREKIYGRDVYIRGLIEYTNHCRNDCRYCGIRRGNKKADRYRLSREQILECCDRGYELGFRTFVLQGGEDPYYTDEDMACIIRAVKEKHPDCALTLSVGEREKDIYIKWYEAGADRYLLRHETADREHYESLHPEEMSYEHRIQCLRNLKEIGYQVGCGMMVGSPGQTMEHLVKDLRLIQKLQPEMVGLGPFIPHRDTEYAGYSAGSVELTLKLLSVIRLMLPEVLLPATTALGTADERGREKGLEAGANVLMPNLSPTDVRGKYLLYDDKICTGEEAAECVRCLSLRVEKAGYRIVVSRGDHPSYTALAMSDF